jgi:hypothetical protein
MKNRMKNGAALIKQVDSKAYVQRSLEKFAKKLEDDSWHEATDRRLIISTTGSAILCLAIAAVIASNWSIT